MTKENDMKSGDIVSIQIRAIKNGFLVCETKRSENSYSTTESDPTFYGTIEEVEGELIKSFRAACSMELKPDSGDF